MGQYKDMLKSVINANVNKQYQNNINQVTNYNNQQGNLRESNRNISNQDNYMEMLDLIEKVDKSL